MSHRGRARRRYLTPRGASDGEHEPFDVAKVAARAEGIQATIEAHGLLKWGTAEATAPEHEPSLAVKENLEPPVDFSEDPAAARDAAADIARDQARTRKPVLEPIYDKVFVEGARKVEDLAGPSLAEEPDPADASAGCVRVKRPRRSREGGKASKRRHRPVPTKAEVVAFGQEFEAAGRAGPSADLRKKLAAKRAERKGARR